MPHTPNNVSPSPVAERKVGRTDPPMFMFPALRTRALSLAQADDGPAKKCISIVAPVGYGKTVMMSLLLEELRRSGKHCVWLGLDERDTSVEGVIDELDGLLHGRDEGLHPTHALFRGNASSELRVDAVIERINRHPLPVTIFIDNLQFCPDPAFTRFLEGLIFRTRNTIQIVMSCTRQLAFDVARAELQGLLTRVGPHDLSFGSAEVAQLLGAELQEKIGKSGIEAVTQRTEGWPAAVRMVQIILSNSDDPQRAIESFSGSDLALAQLLNRQVLAGAPQPIQSFLLRLAQLRTFCVDLCVEAIDADHSGAHLSYLIDRNVFLIPLDRNRQWYRLHGLFRDYLLREASVALTPKHRNEVLLRAAQWCERNGYWKEAIDYALASDGEAIAIEILEKIAPSFVRDRGDVLTYIRWLESLHGQGREAGPEAEFWFVWALAFQRRYEYARKYGKALADRVADSHQSDVMRPSNTLLRRLAIMRTAIESLTDHVEEAHLGASEWLATSATDDDPFNVSCANCIESGYFTNALRFVESRRFIQTARERAVEANSAYADCWVASYAGLIGVHSGEYATAYPELKASLDAARSALGDGAGMCGTMALIAARLAGGMGLTDETRELLQFGVKTSRSHGFLEAIACGIEAAVDFLTGTSDDRVSISIMRDVANAYPPRLSFMLSCFLVRRWVRLGRIDEARVEAARIELNPEAGRRREGRRKFSGIPQLDALVAAVKIDLQIAAGRYSQVAPLMTSEMRRAKTAGCHARIVELELGGAFIALHSQNVTLAVRHVTRAIRVATPRRIVQVFQDYRGLLEDLLSQVRPSAWGFPSEQERSFFAEACRGLPGSAPDAVVAESERDQPPKLFGSLTARELELLSLIDTGLSNQQLADRTDVSLTTIKWHLQNLYGKLGVSSRSAALAKARAMRLLNR